MTHRSLFPLCLALLSPHSDLTSGGITPDVPRKPLDDFTFVKWLNVFLCACLSNLDLGQSFLRVPSSPREDRFEPCGSKGRKSANLLCKSL